MKRYQLPDPEVTMSQSASVSDIVTHVSCVGHSRFPMLPFVS